MRPLTFLVAILLLALVLGGFYFSRDHFGEQLSPESADVVTISKPAQGKNVGQDSENTRSMVLEPEPLPNTGPRVLNLRLLSSGFDEPILGKVLIPDGACLIETDRQGQASLTFTSVSPQTLEFRADGYATLRADLPMTDTAEWIVHLVPKSTTNLIVTDSLGLPVRKARVQTAPLSTRDWTPSFLGHPPQPEVDWKRGFTDKEGLFSWPLASPAIAEVFAPNGLAARVQVSPGETVRITLATETAVLEFVDAESGEPLPNFAITLEHALSPGHGPIELTTNPQGIIQVPANQRELVVCLSDPSSDQAVTNANPRTTRHGDGYSFRFDNLRPDERITIRVTRCSVAIQMIDSTNLEPITGSVTIDNQRRYESPEHGETWISSSSLRRTATLDEGLVAIDCTYLTKKGRLCLQVPGYAPVFVPQAELEKNGQTTRVLATPNAQELRVRVLFADGTPFISKLIVFDDQTRNFSDKTATNMAGWAGPLPWGGGSVTLFCWSYVEPGQPGSQAPPPSGGLGGNGPTRKLLGTLAASDIHSGIGTLVLKISPTYGGLQITGCPDDAPVLEVVDADGIRHRSHHQNNQGVFFESLIPGPYLAGPPAWLDALQSQGVGAADRNPSPLLLLVQEGEILQSPWDPRWRMEESLQGRVICPSGQLSELALKPWYANATGWIGPRDNNRIHLLPDGRYEIPAGSIRPEALLVCTSNSSYWIQVLQAFEPGQDTQVSLGRMVLTWQGPPPNTETVTILYWAYDLEFDMPFTEHNPHGYYLEWNTQAPLHLGAVSTHVTDVRCDMAFGDEKEQRFAIPVTIEDGKTTHVTIGQGLGEVVPLGR